LSAAATGAAAIADASRTERAKTGDNLRKRLSQTIMTSDVPPPVQLVRAAPSNALGEL